MSDDRDLLRRLEIDGEDLSREVALEVVGRGPRMIEPLAALCRDESAWAADDARRWGPVHASLLLGSIGTPAAVEPLLDGMERAVQYGGWPDGVSLPALLAAQDASIRPRLREIALDPERSMELREVALAALLGTTYRAPETRPEILGLVRRIAFDPVQGDESRIVFASALLDQALPEDRDALRALAREMPEFAEAEEVDEEYAAGGDRGAEFRVDWFRFYDPDTTRKRRSLSASLEEMDRWMVAIDSEDEWVEQELRRILDSYEIDALGDLGGDERTAARRVAEGLAAMLLEVHGLPPWKIDEDVASEYLDVLPLEIEPGDLAWARSAPAGVKRFAAYWEGQGRLSAEANRRIASRVDLETALYDRRLAKEAGRGRSKLGRNDPCPCGSGKKFKKCCLGKPSP